MNYDHALMNAFINTLGFCSYLFFLNWLLWNYLETQ